MSEKIIGKVHSIQSLAASDGPGVRFAVFLQGCNLRCGCCHNPDTWNISGGTEYTPMEIVEKAIHYKEYFGVLPWRGFTKFVVDSIISSERVQPEVEPEIPAQEVNL